MLEGNDQEALEEGQGHYLTSRQRKAHAVRDFWKNLTDNTKQNTPPLVRRHFICIPRTAT
jgi:hypothetical protein